MPGILGTCHNVDVITVLIPLKLKVVLCSFYDRLGAHQA